jgi:hypothetical protein
MRFKWTAFGFALSTCLTGASAFADSHGRPVAATPHVQSPKTTGKPTTTSQSAHVTRTGSTSSPTLTSTSSRPAQAPKTTGQPAATGKSAHSTKSGSTSSSSTTQTGPSTRLNPIAAKIASKPQLNARITAMLPKGMTLNQASRGFKNQGQFIAALHVSQNLGCDCFRQIKTDMTRKNMSLGQAIQDVKRTANTTVEVHRAETEADHDVKSVPTTTTATSTATITAKTTTPAGSDR